MTVRGRYMARRRYFSAYGVEPNDDGSEAS
jgi:hypothetical protein